MRAERSAASFISNAGARNRDGVVLGWVRCTAGTALTLFPGQRYPLLRAQRCAGVLCVWLECLELGDRLPGAAIVLDARVADTADAQ
jgi:hypothetical protein